MGKETVVETEIPKLAFTLNHAFKADDPSTRRRQFLIGFSDFYGEDHTPEHDFGVSFFYEWDRTQWDHFHNLMAACVTLYYQFGLVTSNEDQLKQRVKRALAGEDVLTWAEEHFKPGVCLNKRTPRKEVFEDWQTYEKSINSKYRLSTTRFKSKLKHAAVYFGWTFNPLQSGGDDKSAGVEYFTLADDSFNPTKDA